jgi:SAM-dependent methyltransferase
MSLNYDFLAGLCQRYAPSDARILDFGCGVGHLIAAAISRGFDAYGCDRYDGIWSDWCEQTVAHKDKIRRIPECGTIPFDDREFEIVVANQVFEHIDCFRRPLAEIHRVLKPGGIFINCFPTSEVLWEGHVKAPLAQWFFANPKRWRRYLIAMHRMRIGQDRQGLTADEWATSYAYLPSVCFYKSSRQIAGEFASRFLFIESAEPSWIRHRVANNPALSWLQLPTAADPLLRFVCTRLAGRVFVMRRLDHQE